MAERIPSTGINAPLPVTPAQPLERSGDPRLEAFQRTLATMLGSKVPVSVLARMQDGSFMVRVADTPVRMPLPPGTQPGAQLTMTVLAAAPQPTFGLGDATLQGKLVPLGATAAALAASVAAAASSLTASAGRQEGADLSPAARLLALVLQGSAPGPAAPVAGTVPLVSQGPPDPAQLAGQLKQVLARSGLFYEAHLAEWAEGRRPLAELMAEPQAQKAPGTAPTEAASARLIHQQLAAHEGGQLAWHGQLAPGLPLEWEIRREDEAGEEHGQPAAPAWESRLRLRFALLGEVEARVGLHGRHLRIDLRADGAATALLREAGPALQAALAAAGSDTAALRIDARADA